MHLESLKAIREKSNRRTMTLKDRLRITKTQILTHQIDSIHITMIPTWSTRRLPFPLLLHPWPSEPKMFRTTFTESSKSVQRESKELPLNSDHRIRLLMSRRLRRLNNTIRVHTLMKLIQGCV